MTGRELVATDDIDGALVGLEATVEAARAYAESADAPGTRRVYGTAWRQFIQWCGLRGLDSLPATGTTLAFWLSDLAKAGMKPKTLHVKAAAVRWAHMSARDPDGKPLPNPTDTPEVRLVMRGILRDAATRGIRREPADPITAELLRLLVHPIDRKSSVRGRRDAAIILLGFGSAMRRSELAAMEFGDLEYVERGVLVRIRRSKGDQFGEGQAVAVLRARDQNLCPVAALEAWLRIMKAEGSEGGRVFREITKADRILPDSDGLTPESISRIVQKRADLAGVEGRISAHSLRAGFVTTALIRGKPLAKVKDHARHKAVATTLEYFRDMELFEGHPGEGLL
ncbi:site-specific integrase [Azospirillum sp. TSO5]|uniref:site-specific integrase n=1 Tax=Azospirillum sp. TSO5 TaxID=716760 RepID=UPI0011B23D58|nr:site-specific integrase [Azospirillum sp. TSO5]